MTVMASKRAVLFGVLVLLVCFFGYLGLAARRMTSHEPAPVAQTEPPQKQGEEDKGVNLSAYRMERDRHQGERAELLRELLADPQGKEEAQKELLTALGCREKQAEIESLLKSRGYNDVVVFLYPERATVLIDGDIGDHEANLIGNLVVKVAGVKPENVIIIPSVREGT